MPFTTKIDLSQQARIPSGSTANFDGSMNIMTDFFIKNIKINPSNSAASGDLLLYNSITNSYNKGVLSGSNGINIYSQNGNLFVEFTGATATNARVASLANLSTNGILVNSGSTILTVLITGSSDFTFTNANGVGGNPTIGLSNTGVSGGTYGSSASIPVLTVDSKGRITSVSGATVNIPTNYITNINGLTAYTQTFVTETTGTTFNINSSGSNHYFSLPYASGGTVTLGGISNSDYSTFNNKQNAISVTVTGNSGPSTFVSNILNTPTYSLSGLGGLALSGGTLTGTLTGTSFVVSSGTSTQFLKANGSLDSTPNNSFTGSTYSGGTLTFTNLTGGTSSVTGLTSLNGTGYTFVSGTSVTYKYGTSSQFLKADGSFDNNIYLLGSGLSANTIPYWNGVNLVNSLIGQTGNTVYLPGTGGTPNLYSSLHLLSTSLPLKLTSIPTGSLPSPANIGAGGITWNPTTTTLQYSDGSTWNSLLTQSLKIRSIDIQFYNYALQQDISFSDAATITTFINNNNQLTSATYQKFTYNTGTWSGGSVTNITFTAGVSTVSISMALYDFIRVVGVLAGANTQGTLSIKTTIS